MLIEFLLSLSYGGFRLVSWMFSLLLVGMWWFFLREKAGKPFPNALMKQHARTPLALLLLWWIRVLIIFLLSLLLIDTILPHSAGP